MFDLGRPEDDGNSEREAQPKFIAKHRHGVTGVPVVASMGVVDALVAMCFGRMVVVLAGHAIIGDPVTTIQRLFGQLV